jgi:hypothetical protein
MLWSHKNSLSLFNTGPTWQKILHQFQDTNTYQYKWCENCIIELRHPKPEEINFQFYCNEARIVKNVRFAKYRANAMYVTRIWDCKKETWIDECIHYFFQLGQLMRITTYTINKIVIPHDYLVDEWVVCAPGIHYFQSLLAAFLYGHVTWVMDDDGTVPQMLDLFEKTNK